MIAIFVDLTSAFYRAVRSLIVKGGYSDEAIPWLLRELGFNQIETREIAMNLMENAALQDAEASLHLQSVAADICYGAHFHTKGLVDSVITQRGTQPGRSTADLFYNLTMTRILRRINQRLQSAKLLVELNWSGSSTLEPYNGECAASATLCDSTFVDDMVVMLSPTCTSDIKPQIVAATQIIFSTIASYAGKVNVGPGKTEAMVAPRGQGTKEFQIELWTKGKSCIDIPLHGEVHTLRVVEITNILARLPT